MSVEPQAVPKFVPLRTAGAASNEREGECRTRPTPVLRWGLGDVCAVSHVCKFVSQLRAAQWTDAFVRPDVMRFA
jgi:hypothetical protein